MINKIIRNFLAKQAAGRSDDGIMITLRDPQKIEMLENIMADLLMRNGIDPRAITSEAQLKTILNQIEAASKQTTQSGIRNTQSAKVFDLEGKEIPPGSKIMGGKAIDDDLPPPGSRGGKDDIAAPVQSSEETLKNMIEAENKKAVDNLKQKMAKEKARTQRISGNLRADNMNRYEIGKPKLDEDEYDYYREILDDEENFVVKGDETREFLEAMVKEQEDEMAYMKRLYDKGALDDPEKKANGGRIGFRIGSESGKDTSGRDYASDTAASRSVKTSPSRDTGGGGDNNNNQPPQKIKLPEPVKSGIDTYNNLKYLQNLYKMNPQGLLFDVGKQFLINKLFTEANTKQDPNMMLAFEPGSIKDKQLKQMYNIFEETGIENPMMKDLMKEDIEQGGPLSLPEEAYQTAADGGIMRLGFKDGMNRRTFLKLFTGLVSLPVIGKVLKPLKVGKKVTQVPIIKTGDVPGKPEWFDQLVNKVILEGDDVTKRFATQERQVVHMKKIDDETTVTVTQDLNDGSIMVDVDDPIRNVMGERGDDTSVQMLLKKNPGDESNPATADEFSFTEADMRNYMDGPDDYTTEFTENTVSKMSDLTSDLGKIKSYATGKKPTMKEFIESKKRQDKVRFAEEKPAEYAAERGPDIDYSDYEYASGGIARMLGE